MELQKSLNHGIAAILVMMSQYCSLQLSCTCLHCPCCMWIS